MGGLFTYIAMEKSGKPYYYLDWDSNYYVFLRTVIGFVCNIFWYSGITMLPLGDAISLIITNPLFTAILAPLILGEKTNCKKLMTTFLGFCGAIVISKPTFIRDMLGLKIEFQTEE